MKLIYCKNDTTNGIWRQDFNQDIVIKKGSKIGMLNGAFEFEDSITITPNNDRFQFKTSSGHKLTSVFVPHGTYDAVDLQEAVEAAMNGSIRNVGSNIGTQFKLDETDEGFIKILFRRNKPTFLNIPAENSKNLTTLQEGSFSGTPTAGFDSYGFTNFHLNRGSAFAKFKVTTLGGNFIVGLLSEHKRPDSMDHSHYKYGILYNQASGVLETIHDGVKTATLFDLAVNDRLYLQHYGNMHMIRYRGNPGTATLLVPGIPSDYDDRLYPCISFSDDQTVLQQCRQHIDPFSVSDFDGVSNDQVQFYHNFVQTAADFNPETIHLDDPTTNVPPSKFTLDFSLSSLGTDLGFTRDRYTTPPVISGEFTAEQRLISKRISSGLIVAMPNLQIESFNGVSEKADNILMTIMRTIDNKNDDEDAILFKTDRPTMLNLTFDRDVVMREFQFAIRDSIFNLPVTFYDEHSCSLTLMVQDPDE
jgi:hypothetical protein